MLDQFAGDIGLNVSDYDDLTADFLKQNSGFVGSFSEMSSQANPDVVATRIQP